MIVVTTTRPALFGPVHHHEQHPEGESFSTEEDGRLVVIGGGSELATYPAGAWVGARLVCDAELELMARVRELEEELEHARTVGETLAELDLLADDTGADGQEGPEYLAHVDDRLLWLLRTAGREWGPLGVALAAARMSDPAVVRRALKATAS